MYEHRLAVAQSPNEGNVLRGVGQGSSPRMTWLISICSSSMTTTKRQQRHAIGPDDDEVLGRALSKTTSPRMRSSKRIVSGGTRKRTAGRRPWA